MEHPPQFSLTVEPASGGPRLDAWLARHRPEHSRSRWQALIRDGQVVVNGRPSAADQAVHPGEIVAWQEPPPAPARLMPEARELDILYEDAEVLVLNKPPGLVVHPAPGHPAGTLVNALLYHCEDLEGIGGEQRPGIVHRLDKDTTGLLVVAKTERAQRDLVEQFRGRRVHKQYLALVWGHPTPPRGTIRTLIGRHAAHRQKMSAQVESGRPAVTHYRTEETFADTALVRVDLETGRTHQIRVHMAHIGHPILGDAVYGRARRPLAAAPRRQMLHAARLAFQHPGTGAELEFDAPLPDDFRALLDRLRREPQPDGP